jgi:hypothetical protein
MGFAPTKNPFAKPQNEKKPFVARQNDKLIRIEGYDTSNGVMFARDKRGNELAIFIDGAAISRNRKFEATKAKFFGHLIDARMEEALPVGHWVVAERAAFARKMKKGEESINVYSAQRVINSTEQDDEKLFEGIFTVAAMRERIAAVQSWSDVAFSPREKDKLVFFASELGKKRELFDAGERVEFAGFMLRAMVLSEDGESYVCVDSSFPMDHLLESDGERNKAIPIGRDTFVGICRDYSEYLKGLGIEGCVVDVMTYRNIKGSIQAKALEIGSQFSALAKMSSRESVCSNGDDPFAGKNWAVRGIVELSGDEIKKEGRNVSVIPRDLVMKLHANGFNCDVREMVLAFDGKKVKLSDSLRIKREEASGQGQVSESVVSDERNGHVSQEVKDFIELDPFDSLEWE